MPHSIFTMMASFSTPMNITTDPKSMLWMFPLLLAVAIVYKATKAPVIFPARFAKEVALLFMTMSVLMAAAAAGLIILTQIVTS
jgi:hypothetical protein